MTERERKSLARFEAPDEGALTAQMLAAYEKDGVVILENFVTAAACARLRQRALELVDEFDPAVVRSVFSTTKAPQLDDRYFIESGDKIRFFMEQDAFDADGRLRQSKDASLNKMGHAMHDLDPVFSEFSHSRPLARIASDLGIADPAIIQSMYIFKPPHIGGEVVCHQDSTYLYTEPESCTGFWFALEDATTENGCMYFIPGAHRLPLKRRNFRESEFRLKTVVLDDTPWPETEKLAAPAPRGSVVIFSGRAPHMSPANTSKRSRHAYSLHAIDGRCHYPQDNWLQRDPSLPLRGFV